MFHSAGTTLFPENRLEIFSAKLNFTPNWSISKAKMAQKPRKAQKLEDTTLDALTKIVALFVSICLIFLNGN